MTGRSQERVTGVMIFFGTNAPSASPENLADANRYVLISMMWPGNEGAPAPLSSNDRLSSACRSASARTEPFKAQWSPPLVISCRSSKGTGSNCWIRSKIMASIGSTKLVVVHRAP